MFHARKIEEAQQHVLRVTQDFLAMNHDEKLRVARIAESAEMSTSVIYSYFDSREGLIDAAYLNLYREQNDLITATITSWLAGSSAVGKKLSLDQLHEIERAVLEKLADSGSVRLRTVVRAIANPSYEKRLHREDQRHLEELTRVLGEAYPNETAPMILSLVKSTLMLSLVRASLETLGQPISESQADIIFITLMNPDQREHLFREDDIAPLRAL